MNQPAIWVDVVVAVLLVEAIALGILAARGRVSSLRALIPNLAAGLFLVLALRCALHDQGAAAIGVFLALGGIAHAVDLRVRLR